MKRTNFFHFTKLGLALLFFLALEGCQKDDTASTDELSTATPLFLKGTEPPLAMTEARCDCEYQIVSETHTTPPSGQQFAYDVLTTENCVSTLNCRYFRYVEGCDFEGPEPCADYVAAGISKPTQWYPFNCQQVFYSTFYVTVANAYFWSLNA
ncbi:MAG: hypothetical protein HY842_02325, partial [Bacteroidetes bacterium]|nr:hypothetical protein [Bacteroidota bacterium]